MSNSEMKTILSSLKFLESKIEKRVIALEERVSTRFDRLESRMTNIEFFMQGLTAGKDLAQKT